MVEMEEVAVVAVPTVVVLLVVVWAAERGLG